MGSVCIAVILFGYCCDIWSGIIKHDPPCAPITMFATSCVVLLGVTGLLAGAAALVFGRWLWRAVAGLGCAGCATALGIWIHWLLSDQLLPYEQFVVKVGMP